MIKSQIPNANSKCKSKFQIFKFQNTPKVTFLTKTSLEVIPQTAARQCLEFRIS